MPRSPTRTALLALVAVLLLTGACSSDDGGSDQRTASAPGSATTEQAEATVASLIGTGLSQIASSDYDSAKQTFETVLDLDHENDYGWYNLGYIAQLQGDDATAIQRYTTTLTNNKDFSPALYNLALLTESSDLTAAVALYRREIAVEPADAAAHMRLGFALRHLGHEPEAAQLLKQGITLDPAMADIASPTYR